MRSPLPNRQLPIGNRQSLHWHEAAFDHEFAAFFPEQEIEHAAPGASRLVGEDDEDGTRERVGAIDELWRAWRDGRAIVAAHGEGEDILAVGPAGRGDRHGAAIELEGVARILAGDDDLELAERCAPDLAID